jgi:hypothetical protein
MLQTLPVLSTMKMLRRQKKSVIDAIGDGNVVGSCEGFV